MDNRSNDLLATIGKTNTPVRRWMVDDMREHGFSGSDVYRAIKRIDAWLKTGDKTKLNRGAVRLYALLVQDTLETACDLGGDECLPR